MFPLMLDLRGRPCLVVGAGPIAHRKLLQLLAESARVTVVAPSAIEPVARLAAAGAITLVEREFVETDVIGAQLVLVATNDPAVDAQVAAAARARGIWVNVADVPDLCDFHLPATVRRGDLQLSIASGGGAPFAVRRLRQLFEQRIGPLWADWLAAAKRFRQRLLALRLPAAAADACYDRFFGGTVDAHALTARIPTENEMAAWCRDPAPSVPAVSEPSTGQVALVGSGPGNPGLLTVQGMNLLRSADAVVYDRLSIPTLPLDLPDTVELHPVGKQPGNHPVPQDQINALLVRLARMGKRVVRLKGGDPFVFARGGEELAVLREAGIPCEAVPGVTAGIAGPAAAGIPVTFRGEAVRLTFVTAHEGGSPQVRWDLLAQDRHATLVGYMGVSTLAEAAAALLAHGMDPATPAAVIEQATLPGQHAVRAPVAEIAAVARQQGIKSPAIFVIGRVVAHAERLAPASGPLRGLRIAMFAPGGALGDELAAAGADVVAVPQPLTRVARLVLSAAPLHGWVARTADEVVALARAGGSDGSPVEARLFCTNEAVAREARDHGFADVVAVCGSDGIRELIAALVPSERR
jgi:uroporphyrin-III C-methyltransferase / precorrin-2 dehydrogenase / sirohydrochlorin ferrochelatase